MFGKGMTDIEREAHMREHTKNAGFRSTASYDEYRTNFLAGIIFWFIINRQDMDIDKMSAVVGERLNGECSQVE